jgi:hypothetical protein
MSSSVRATRGDNEIGSDMDERGVGGGRDDSVVVREDEPSVSVSSVKLGDRGGVDMVIVVEGDVDVDVKVNVEG